jgi:hypothetical protein
MVDVPPTPPPNEGKGEDERYLTLVSSTQREINRLTDEDRNTRKRGLQKLLDEVPWAGKGGSGTKKAVKQFAVSILLPAVLGVTIESGKGTGGGEDGAESGAVQAAFSFRGGTGTLVDIVEKVRELSLQVVKKSVENITTLSSNALIAIIQMLCKRISTGDGSASSYPEVAEELRLQVLDNLLLALTAAHKQFTKVQTKRAEAEAEAAGEDTPSSSGAVVVFEKSKYKVAIEALIVCLPRALSDPFPQSKRSAAELVRQLGGLAPYATRLHFRSLAHGLIANCGHQHGKTRSMSVQALSSILGNITEDFEAVMGKMANPAAPAAAGGERSVAEDFYNLGAGGAGAGSGGGGGSVRKIDLTVLFHKLASDTNANVRRELCSLCALVMSARFARYEVVANSGSGSNPGATATAASYVTAAGELELCLLLLLLCGDEVEEVRAAAYQALEEGCGGWLPGISKSSTAAAAGIAEKKIFSFSHDSGSDFSLEDAERAMQSAAISSPGSSTGGIDKIQGVLACSRFVGCHIHGLSDALCRGVTDWTADSRLRYLYGLHTTLLIAGPEAALSVSDQVLRALGSPCRDDDVRVRTAAESCCAQLAAVVSSVATATNTDASLAAAQACASLVGRLLPRLAGTNYISSSSNGDGGGGEDDDGEGSEGTDAVPAAGISGSTSGGGNTASQRGNAVRVLTHVLRGMRYRYQEGFSGSGLTAIGGAKASPQFWRASSVPLAAAPACIETGAGRDVYVSIVGKIALALKESDLYEFRDEWFREALVLLVRALVEGFPSQLTGPDHSESERALLLALVYLMGRLTGESEIVPAAAQSVLVMLCTGGGNSNDNDDDRPPPEAMVKAVFSLHFTSLLSTILEHSAGGLQAGESVVRWDASDPARGAFDQLVRTCPAEAWREHERILKLIVPQVQLPAILGEKDAESIAKTYKAVAGETNAFADADEANVRLTLMALLEGWVRAGALDWNCSKYLSAAAPVILSDIICKNLVWRVGRVEGTVRKVTLATAHAMLRAGAVTPQTLYAVAKDLVPQLCSQLDDNETSMRHIAALSVTVVFERLKGAFGPQAVSEMYPILVKRFDDSNDDVRRTCVEAMASFMSASVPGAFSGTAIDYTLDQLFIHLDDANETIQEACYQTIMAAAALPGNPGAGGSACATYGDLARRKAREQRGSHRSPARCDLLLKGLPA